MSDDDGSLILSETATRDLLKLLVTRGYFHHDVVPERANKDRRNNDDCVPHCAETDLACQLVTTYDGSCLTKDQLQVRLKEELASFGGRMSLENCAVALAIDPKHVAQVSEDTSSSSSSTTTSIVRVRDDLITKEYFDRMAQTTNLLLAKRNGGRVAVSELASSAVWDTPMDVTMSALKERIENQMIGARLVSHLGANVLVTPAFEKEERRRIRGAFRAIALPTHVDAVCHDFQWDVDYVVPILEDLCEGCEVAGEVHRSGTSLTGAMFIPNIYLSMQRRSVDEFFASNGFITAEEGLAMGVLESRMGDYVRESTPSALVLPNSVISRDVIVVPVEQALIESLSSDSFVDLRLHLPESLMKYEQDVRTIVEEMALLSVVDAPSKNEGGSVVFTNGEALFVSQGMIQHISKTLLPPLIESFAKTRSEQMYSWRSGREDKDEELELVPPSKKKKGRKVSKKAKAALSQSKESIHCGVVPLVIVAKTVANAYPDLSDIQSTVGPLFDQEDSTNAPIWEEGEDSNGNVGGGPLYDLCRRVIYNDEFQSNCEGAVKAELERLESIKSSRSVRSRKEGAAKMRSIESSFEDAECFAAACYAIQEHVKFLQYVETLPNVDESITVLLKDDYLRGCCADFTGRITQYCLFRNEIEDGLILVESEKSKGVGSTLIESDIPEYCQPIDITARRYPSTTLKCIRSSDSEPKSMPLPTLREVLPGGVGKQLARTWTLCGGKCYEGGSRVDEDGFEMIRPGGADAFLPHVEENCLTMCGLPFKKLDKKAEKTYLFGRRKALTEQLESANEPQDVLELTIMLLFQQVKGLVVTGPLLSTIVLELLQSEKKITAEVSQQLQQLADAVNANARPDGTLISAVKACGLSRDISKHIVACEIADNAFSCPNDALCGMLQHLQ